MTSGVLRASAPAKLNLYLHVTGRRADGYHLLDSLVAFAGIADTVEVAPSRDLALEIDGPFASALGAESATDNIVMRAARRLASAAGIDAKAAIRLTKRLPVAAGIGGGSSDAAAVLRLLRRLWAIDLPQAVMDALALELGADVPVCGFARAAFVGGIGEEIVAAPALPPAAVLLVNPLRPLPTNAVFALRRGDYSAPGRFSESPRDAKALASILRERRNDLTAAASDRMPEIAAIIAAIGRTDGCLLARMSGSGATCFGLFATMDEAQAAAVAAKSDHSGWWIEAAPLLTDIRGEGR
ncbi:MAG: 4-(cytidine 5'-diphospho)-2-C-methyl-D-erythritol kinase [Alphaproteobacteria bacterium]